MSTEKEEIIIQSAIEYVELEADTKVTSVEIVDEFTHFGDSQYVLSVETTDDDYSSWWVVAGATPTNLYPKNKFESPDYVYSFHRGLMSRLQEKQILETDGPPEDGKYDVFVCHSSKDKVEFVEPLVRELKRRGIFVWYDDDEVRIGDSIRESIDEGLSRAHCGIVVLSDSFFEKNWTRYELNGLTSRDVESESPIILPVWYGVEKEDVSKHSPPLADKKAVQTDGEDIIRVARILSSAISSSIREQLGIS